MQIPQFGASTTFDDACAMVLEYLQAAIPMGFWSVTRHSQDTQLYLAVKDSVYGQRAGNSHLWSDSMCQYMLAGDGPRIAPDVEQVPAYAGAGVRRDLRIGAYVGLPLLQADGEVFGTLCGLDEERQPAELKEHEPLLQILAQLLTTILQTDLMRTQAEQLAERSATAAETDVLTGLYNRRGWDRFLATEEARYRRFGHTGSVIILDLDSLKLVNDRYGHDAGDAHIRQAARAIAETTRDMDIVARLGGDEFGILAAHTNSEQAQHLVDRLSEQLTLVGTPGSIGYAPYSIISGFPGAWQSADAAMYEQKRHRRAAASQSAKRIQPQT
ncbi:diguanylate cyclase (GGDEF) domain-containing protein [Nakamurella panacisegetis]|uniref:Diguanylate cyclase (GGDEF) domain-containing protein n=1 Tax=Nakamurella panacisegetis TaxID=1090615 RepID=A0A1H0N7C0_9ACTN|nr:sensor domain-containing diguanylate cyclase [Nakamurella panacisegetis]SDO88426.1 diguanylate cyclase (GGDEF) domain-containing protein [Nakamurella panacisegetis]